MRANCWGAHHHRARVSLNLYLWDSDRSLGPSPSWQATLSVGQKLLDPVWGCPDALYGMHSTHHTHSARSTHEVADLTHAVLLPQIGFAARFHGPAWLRVHGLECTRVTEEDGYHGLQDHISHLPSQCLWSYFDGGSQIR